LWQVRGDGRGLARKPKKPLMEELTEMIQEVVLPPAGNNPQWIENFIKETVKEKLDYLSQLED
jgi:hypothetical protein